MKETELLNEWVLEDMGKVWVGPHTSAKGRHWVFGQFDDSVLPLVMILLEKSGVPFPSRGNPILVSRALSKMVCKMSASKTKSLQLFICNYIVIVIKMIINSRLTPMMIMASWLEDGMANMLTEQLPVHGLVAYLSLNSTFKT